MDKSALLGSVSVVLVLLLVQSCFTVRAQFANGTENVLLDDDSSFTLDGRREFLTVTPTSLQVGTLFLEIEYYGELRKDNAGFYRVIVRG
ncbi:hypothetical protein quinque_012126 [Culex quinquefasciatus]